MAVGRLVGWSACFWLAICSYEGTSSPNLELRFNVGLALLYLLIYFLYI